MPEFFKHFLRRTACAFFALAFLISSGCLINRPTLKLPHKEKIERGQLHIHTNFRLPKKHRLVEELVAIRTDISNRLNIDFPDEPINVFLFENAYEYDQYISQHYPELPYRRAFFMKTDTELRVFAYWGDRVAEDLRHEVTHGYLHSVIPNLPIWLDEGLAEYFEVPRGWHGSNLDHIEMLAAKVAKDKWQPDLKSLEQKVYMSELEQIHYAESWLWIHWMLETTPNRLYTIRQQIAELIENGETESTQRILENLGDKQQGSPLNELLLEHLSRLQTQHKHLLGK